METLTYSSGRASGCDSPGLLNLLTGRGRFRSIRRGGRYPSLTHENSIRQVVTSSAWVTIEARMLFACQ